jgi:DNA repair protein RecO
MPLVKVRGIVIKATNVGEADKIITLFTDRLGKIGVVVHGARKAKSRFIASSQIFSYSEFVLYSGRNLYTVNQAELIESFQVVLEDLYTLTYCSYMVELIDALIQNDEANTDLFLLFLKTMYLMTDPEIDRELLVRVFELKAMSIAGYMPNLGRCSICRGDNSPALFSVKHGGIICSNCTGNEVSGIKLSMETLSVMRYLMKINIEKIRTIKVSMSVKNDMKKILKNYIKYYLEREFKSLDFLSDIEKFNKT